MKHLKTLDKTKPKARNLDLFKFWDRAKVTLSHPLK